MRVSKWSILVALISHGFCGCVLGDSSKNDDESAFCERILELGTDLNSSTFKPDDLEAWADGLAGLEPPAEISDEFAVFEEAWRITADNGSLIPDESDADWFDGAQDEIRAVEAFLDRECDAGSTRPIGSGVSPD